MNQIEKYFNAEKIESALFIGIGVVALVLGIYFIQKTKQPYFNGIAYPIIGIALIQLIVGFSIYYRSPKDIIRVNQIIQSDVSRIQLEEVPRMKQVMKNFEVYRKIEIVLIIIGIVLFISFKNDTFYKGLGLGLFAQSSLMLLLDLFAERRGKIYLEFLEKL